MTFQKIIKNKQAMTGLIMILIVMFIMLFAPLLIKNNPFDGHLEDRFSEATSTFPLGTDHLGRCMYSRLIYGTRYSLGIAIPVLIVVFTISIILGMIAAYFGGLLDRIFIGICDIAMAFPPMIIILVLVSSFGQGVTGLVLAMVIAIWVWHAKIVRSLVLVEKNKAYVTASRIVGCSHLRIMIKHIVPNILPSLIVFFSLSIGDMIIMISSFSFLGLGVESHIPEWGAMTNMARKFIYTKPYLALYPGICIFFTVVGFNVFGEGLRDIISSKDR